MYNIKKETKAYIVYEGKTFNIDIYPDYNFNQTFTEVAINKRTLHDQNNVFQDAVIVKANPANFNFTTPLYNEDDLDDDIRLVVELLINCSSFDLYFEGNTKYKLTKCVIETGTFQFARDNIVTLSIAGTASRLTEDVGVGASAPYVDFSYLPIMPYKFSVNIDSEQKEGIAGITVELQNKISWITYGTLHESLSVSSETNSIYPLNYVIDEKVLSGTVQQYLTSINKDTVNTWRNGVPIVITAGKYDPLIIDIPNAIFTNRLDPTADLFMQFFDFRMTSTNTNLTDIVRYL